MNSNLIEMTFEIEIQPGEQIRLPQTVVDKLGPGRWLVTVQPAKSETRIRNHDAFLSSYGPEDEGLYDAYEAR